ncbi:MULTISPECIES: amino acid permease [Paenibacillus]|uniref:GABA permease (4-amino butyrate transport carrier) n=1 Tax=Paenibacillus odorifer TaxID=189426 RepID=A0A1R0Y374_9BACL|nr:MULTISPECIES: amino acid permease [Paenibacillus]AIQ36242.1 GABA permease (4-amino butyrate transport carrier) [Paenibacillus sp. FSL R5-0345]OMD41763.1 GABA permease (4-amino butyrate transport carrier) [Paenibacillus odorifer]
MKSNEASLQKKLLPRHISFMAMGGVIGTGIFKGSSETISIAGPAVILTYVLAGLLLLVVMGAIAEMATVYPNRNMKDFIREAFGERLSFIVGWLYCFMWLTVCVIEVLAAGSFLQYWLPDVPLWLLSLASGALIIGINMMSVGGYGETEFWLAGIKIAMIIIFIILGSSLIFGLLPMSEATPYLHNFTDYGGFLPRGWAPIFSALLVVMFSYGGSELIGLTLTETQDAEKVLPKVVKSFILRVILFYTLPILVICGLIPWNQLNEHTSPFVQVLAATGLKGADHVMNFILITAVLSAANSGIYGATRMLHSMASQGEAPRSLAKTSAKGVPINSLKLCAVVLVIGSMLAYFAQDGLFRLLMAVPGFVVILVWISICMSQLKLRKSYPKEPTFKVWGFPYITVLTLACLAVIAVSFLFDAQNRISIGTCLAVVLMLTIWSFLKFKKKN